MAALTTKIKAMAAHMRVHRKDYHSRRGLQAMLNQRRTLLQYLRRKDFDSYAIVLSRLGLKDNYLKLVRVIPWPPWMHTACKSNTSPHDCMHAANDYDRTRLTHIPIHLAYQVFCSLVNDAVPSLYCLWFCGSGAILHGVVSLCFYFLCSTDTRM